MLSDTSAHTILESLPEPHCLVGKDLVCLGANSSFAALLGTRVDALVGNPVSAFWPTVERTPWLDREFSAEFSKKGGAPLIVRICTFDGDVRLIRVMATFSADKTSEVFHGQRLETLGLLAGGVAHDFNNLLTGILGHLAYVRSVLPGNGGYSESLQAIEEGALRAASLTQQILKFSKVDAASTTTRIELGDLVARVATLMKSAIPSIVRLNVVPSEKPVVVMASESYLSQVIINLIVNARDAIEGSGEVVVRLEPRCDRAGVEALFGKEPPSPAYCTLVVEDTGAGMDEEVKARLFEPYFTTKKESGTGLGLSTVHSIVKELGGGIVVESERGKGTTFRIVLPADIDAHEDTESYEDDSAPVRGNGEKVLIIDDEYAVRNVLGLSLSHLGYAVETACSGLEGVEKYAEAKGSFDLVILDMLMPGLSGEEVFARIREMNPTCRVLLVSGFSSEHVVSKILEQGGMDFIQKPFLIEVLSRKVRGCLCD